MHRVAKNEFWTFRVEISWLSSSIGKLICCSRIALRICLQQPGQLPSCTELRARNMASTGMEDGLVWRASRRGVQKDFWWEEGNWQGDFKLSEKGTNGMQSKTGIKWRIWEEFEKIQISPYLVLTAFCQLNPHSPPQAIPFPLFVSQPSPTNEIMPEQACTGQGWNLCSWTRHGGEHSQLLGRQSWLPWWSVMAPQKVAGQYMLALVRTHCNINMQRYFDSSVFGHQEKHCSEHQGHTWVQLKARLNSKRADTKAKE